MLQIADQLLITRGTILQHHTPVTGGEWILIIKVATLKNLLTTLQLIGLQSIKLMVSASTLQKDLHKAMLIVDGIMMPLE